ncbi:SDR family NAD(P)-dependent oxidoreductase [Actibacterium pelagium]|uniref:Short-chain dehydrogenase/reductase SDR n=1 Tax=Actibacterium pelagium TaxID=2029103 RepID=A0A917AJY7_9RHOB|nr:SDR family NAD(P)-dependent oxidoreductase [Actibacterium pelagium]GGE58292.1 short-chain dehydrogenase/reductase SDR [Actibacterium pelagium]
MKRNEINLSDLTAVVTGGAQGIGYAVAARFLASGARVALWDLDEALAARSAEKLGPLGQVIPVACNVSNSESVTSALAQTEAKLGPVDILVNSAGIAGPNAAVEDYDNAAFRDVIDINLMGTFFTNKAVTPGMKARNFGRIVNIASVAGKEGNPNASAYSASKAGVIAFTKSLGKELAGHDIAVNCITPAAARTAIFDQLEEEFIEYMLSKIPRNRFVEVEEAAAMIAWMASPENSFTTGAAFDLSGGRATY